MHTSLTATPRRFISHALTVSALLALTAGLIAYLFTRSAPPTILEPVLALLGPNAQSRAYIALPFAYQLPSFLHMLALMLAAAAITSGQRRYRAIALIVTFGIGLAMELVQHPAVTNTVSACSVAVCSWFPGFKAYALTGTFDPLDVYAIVLAVIVALVIIIMITAWSKPRRVQKEKSS